MTAARLRSAAARLREVAEGASAGPWEQHEHHVFAAEPAHSRPSVANTGWGAREQAEPDAAYIATMSPPVALAVAMWLESTADAWPPTWEPFVDENGERYVPPRLDDPWLDALAVADAVLSDREQVPS